MLRATKLIVVGLSTLVIACGEDPGAGADDDTTETTTSTSHSGAGGSTSSIATGTGGNPSTGAGGGDGGGGMAWGPEHCPALPAGVTIGTDVGQQLPSLEVRDCDGNPVSLDAFCGADAMFLFALHAWCPICQSVSSKIEQIHDDYAGQNLATVLVVISDVEDAAPDAVDCANVRAQHGHQDVVTLYDPNGIIEPIWNGSSGLSAYLDQDGVITGKLVHEGSETAIRNEIDNALAD